MSSEQQAEEQKRVKLSPADKTDQPHRAREASVSTVFTEDVLRLSASTSLIEAIKLMNERQCPCAAVFTADECIAGLLTERDVLAEIVSEDIDLTRPVETLISRPPTLSPQATVGDAVQVMSERDCLYVVVSDGKRLLGLVSVDDVIRYLAESYPKEVTNLPPVPAQVMDTPEGG